MIGAIIVLYNPDFELLFKGLEALLPQVDEVCIIDNSLTNNACKINHLHKVHYMPLCKNIGIAAAQNIGIKYFLSRQFNYVVFSDQDSVISENAIIDLVNAHKLLAEKYKIATILGEGKFYNKKYCTLMIVGIILSIISVIMLVGLVLFDEEAKENLGTFIVLGFSYYCFLVS